MIFNNIANFSKTSDYLPIFNGVLLTDLFVIFLLNSKVIKSTVLREWYDAYNLSAIIADVLIIFIGLIITRAVYYYVFDQFSIIQFTSLAVVVQIIHDVLFYFIFESVPRGVNRMLDTFKDYAKDVSYKAIFADSGMMIMASLLGSYFAGKTFNFNFIVLIVSMYFMPYLLYN